MFMVMMQCFHSALYISYFLAKSSEWHLEEHGPSASNSTCITRSQCRVRHHNHQVLLNRLRLSFGIRGYALEWIASYLSDRTQCVSFENNFSQSRYLSCGVPQGSCLGPLLFTMYASKLSDIIKGHLPRAHAYADDSQLYLSFKPDNTSPQSNAVDAMERCIRAIRCWMIKDKLKVNDIRRIRKYLS